MRETKAKAIAFGTGALILGAASLFATLQQDGSATSGPEGTVSEPGGEPSRREAAPRSAPAQDSVVLAGRAVYEERGCAGCHSIAGEGSPRSPLDGVGNRLSAEEIRLWIVDPQSARPGVRKPAFDDLPQGDVDVLVAYLQTLRG